MIIYQFFYIYHRCYQAVTFVYDAHLRPPSYDNLCIKVLGKIITTFSIREVAAMLIRSAVALVVTGVL